MAYSNKIFNALADIYIKDTACDGQLFCGCREEDCELHYTKACRECLLTMIKERGGQDFEQSTKAKICNSTS